jgi:hypothetical protein
MSDPLTLDLGEPECLWEGNTLSNHPLGGNCVEWLVKHVQCPSRHVLWYAPTGTVGVFLNDSFQVARK